MLKTVLKRIISKKMMDLFLLVHCYTIDFIKYIKYSCVIFKKGFYKIETELILNYHSLEKGFLHKNIKYKFGEKKVKRLLELFNTKMIFSEASQAKAAKSTLLNYYKFHEKNNIDIEYFFPKQSYISLKNNINDSIPSVVNINSKDFFGENESNFKKFSKSRSSVRKYSNITVPIDEINKVISLANNAPSVCNRQPNKVYFVNEKSKVAQILKIQGGLNGYENEINQLLVLVSNRNYFYTVGERNQLYVDGGIYLMNLLYALHYYKIAACPAHWALLHRHNKKIREILKLDKSQQVVALVTIGYPEDEFKVCNSVRRPYSEVIELVD